jgi:hypothetical protein
MSKDDAPSTHFRLSIVMLWISLQICVQTLIHCCASCLTKTAPPLDDIAVSQFFKRARMDLNQVPNIDFHWAEETLCTPKFNWGQININSQSKVGEAEGGSINGVRSTLIY